MASRMGYFLALAVLSALSIKSSVAVKYINCGLDDKAIVTVSGCPYEADHCELKMGSEYLFEAKFVAVEAINNPLVNFEEPNDKVSEPGTQHGLKAYINKFEDCHLVFKHKIPPMYDHTNATARLAVTDYGLLTNYFCADISVTVTR